MRGIPLLLVLCVAGAVLLAGCTGDEATGDTYGGDGSRELSTDVEVAPGDGSDGGEAGTNETTRETGSGG